MAESAREVWAKRVERWRDSGLSGRAFAAELGVSPHTLAWWSSRLRAQERAPAAARRVRSSPAGDPATPLTFVEVPTVAGAPFEVVLPSAIRVRLQNDFDSVALRRLLEVLEARR